MVTPALDVILERYARQARYLIEILQDVQQEEGYLPAEALKAVAEALDVPQIEVYRVATFYKAFSLSPRGEHVITVCTGTACHVRGAPLMIEELRGQLGVEPGDTTEDGLFTLECVNCLGTCALGPVVVLDGLYHDHMSPGKLRKLVQSVRKQHSEVTTNA